MVQPVKRRKNQGQPVPKPATPQLRLHTGRAEAEARERVQTLLDKIEKRTAIVGIVGLGYVGLPFAVEKAKVGFKVLGIEQNVERADKVNRGENYIPDIKDEELRDLVQQGKLEAVTDYAQVPKMDVIVIAVPTPLTKNLNPDLQYVEHVTRELARNLRPGPPRKSCCPSWKAPASRWKGTSSWPILPSASIPAMPAIPPRTPTRLWAESGRSRTRPRSPSIPRPLKKSFRFPAPMRRKWSRSSRTPSGPSTSPWSTS